MQKTILISGTYPILDEKLNDLLGRSYDIAALEQPFPVNARKFGWAVVVYVPYCGEPEDAAAAQRYTEARAAADWATKEGLRCVLLIDAEGGLLVDIFFGDVIGLYALIYMYVGFFGGLFKKMFYSDHVFMPLLLVFSGDFAYNMGCYTFRLLLRNKLDFSYYFWNIFFPEMIITTFVTLIVYKLFYLLNEKVLTQKQENKLSFDR